MTAERKVDPKPAALQAALRKITETIACELGRPGRTAPGWSDFEWTIARAVAAMHGVSPLLSGSLQWRGPDEWVNFLAQQRSHTALRHARIERLLEQIDLRARASDLAMTALKGAALHSMGLYSAGERPMADVDLLVRANDAGRAARLIESLDFCESSSSWRERVYTPVGDRVVASLGEHANNNLKIELHERICERLPIATTDVSHVIFPPQPHAGLNPYPSNAALMIHLLLHAAGSMVFKLLRLAQLHDMALLAARMTAGDWDEILELRARTMRLWWALPPLRLMLRYYDAPIPAGILNPLRSGCPWYLDRLSRRRTLSDVSYSHLWVDAFPGIEWSQSASEMLAYTISRVRPNAQHLALRETVARTNAWAAGSPWTNLSQSRRILRWATSRQTRPVTMHTVRAALAPTPR